MDFDGDRQAEMVFASSLSNEWIIQNQNGTSYLATIGQPGDRTAAADYDGDHKEDVAIVHNKGGQLIWTIQRSSDSKEVQIEWGLDGDTLVPGDYDGDGLADVAVWRSSDAEWYILASKSGEMIVQHWGERSDLAMPGDYDGDGVMDVCVYRPETSSFFFFTSTSDSIHETVFGPFVMSGNEVFVPADYDGDGKTDFAMYDATKSGTFTILETASGKYNTMNIAGSSPVCGSYSTGPCSVLDFAIPADYDHDGRIDPAIWDSIKNAVRVVGSKNGLMVFTTGTTEEMRPVSSFFMSK
jgi:hypothetical protein